MITPKRVVVDIQGYAVRPSLALERYKVNPEIVFVRDDGWTLGSPAQFEQAAYHQWTDKWVAFQRNGQEQKPISEYQPS